METSPKDRWRRGGPTLEASRGHATDDGSAPPDAGLEAALQRDLASAGPTDSHANAPMVEAWARQLGLDGTALLTTEEVAPLLRICERSVRQGIKDGRIPHVRLGRRLFVPVPKLLAMLLEERDPHR